MRGLMILFLLMCHAVVHAEGPRKFGTWTVRSGDVGTNTYVFSEAGEVASLGLLCLDRCTFYLTQPLGCDDGDSYPAIMTSKLGAIHIELICGRLGEGALFHLQPQDLVVKAITAGGKVAIALAAPSAEIDIHRFDVEDAREAIDYVITLTEKKKKKL